MGRKRAVLVGINYPGTKAELKGCLNDVARMRRCLVDRFGFDEAGIRVLADADPTAMQPTGANIRQELGRLVSDARPGDYLFFHYSGHGTRLPAETGHDDDTGYDECIVPCDMNLITDQDFTDLVLKVPDGCLFTVVSDSCHSGGLLDKAKEQIGNSTKQSQARQGKREERSDSGTGFRSFIKETVREVLDSPGAHLPHRGQQQNSYAISDEAEETLDTVSDTHGYIKNRSLPLSTFMEMLKEKTGKDDIKVGSIRMTLFHLFGDDASPKIKKFMKVMMGKLQEGGVVGFVGAMAQEFLKAKLEGGKDEEEALKPAMKEEVHNVREAYAGTSAGVPHNGVLVSGCQTDQTSADATTPRGVSYGALSNAIQAILAERKGGKVTNRELVLRARELLSKQGYKQQPGLYCSDSHSSVGFIC